MNKDNLIKQIDAILPQTQCTRCGYPSCMDYAKALAGNTADINQCPPGGDDGIAKLSKLLEKPIKGLNPNNGTIKPRQVVAIDEEVCIGCTLCIKACPVDAILGSNKMMHTVIGNECTGCELCIPVCPVDCITMEDIPNPNWNDNLAKHARERYHHHQYRKERDKKDREARLKEKAIKSNNYPNEEKSVQKDNLIEQILAKVNKS